MDLTRRCLAAFWDFNSSRFIADYASLFRDTTNTTLFWTQWAQGQWAPTGALPEPGNATALGLWAASRAEFVRSLVVDGGVSNLRCKTCSGFAFPAELNRRVVALFDSYSPSSQASRRCRLLLLERGGGRSQRQYQQLHHFQPRGAERTGRCWRRCRRGQAGRHRLLCAPRLLACAAR